MPLYLELTVPADYPDSVPQPDLSNVNNAPYTPAVKQKAITQMLEQVTAGACQDRRAFSLEYHCGVSLCARCHVMLCVLRCVIVLPCKVCFSNSTSNQTQTHTWAVLLVGGESIRGMHAVYPC